MNKLKITMEIPQNHAFAQRAKETGPFFYEVPLRLAITSDLSQKG